MSAKIFGSYSLIDHHIRTYRNILKQAHEVRISQLIDSHIQMRSILHEKGDQDEVDTSAFIYSILRLPDCISHVHTILLGQSSTVFKKNGFSDVESWQEVSSPGRRRKMFYDGDSTLAVYISSVSDVDDMICLLAAYQIEWNKFHRLLNSSQINDVIPQEDKDRLTIIVKNNYGLFLNAIRSRMLDYRVCLLSGSYIEYFRSTQMWWNHIKTTASHLHIEDRPVYFISSNTHAIANILTRTSITCEKEILEFVRSDQDKALSEKYADVFDSDSLHDKEFFLYYTAKKYERANPEYRKRKQIDEDKIGFMTIYPTHYIDVPAQIVEVKNLTGRVFHEQFPFDTKPLAKSDAIIINIDYPLGWSAYQIFSEISQNVEYLAGVYIMGKVAILHGDIGDIVLPVEVYDDHTKNVFSFSNALESSRIKEWYKTGAVFTAQKSRTVKGTFFQNAELLRQWYKENYTVIEMEAGPYLNAISECVFYNRYGENQVIHIPTLPFDFGMAHYASDTPNSKAKNLGVRNLSYDGVECTYSIAMAILARIVEQETKR